MTIAPEIEGALDLITEASRRGVCVSLGHSDADLSQGPEAAIGAGARHATHTFNAMRPLDHRNPGLLGAVLTDNALTADIIVDGIHVDPVDGGLVRSRQRNRRCSADHRRHQRHRHARRNLSAWGLEVQVRDGRCEFDGRLAGSVLTLDRAVRNTMQFAHISLQHAIRMATLNPARVLGIEKRKGNLSVGADADIAVFTPAGEVVRTIVGGIVN